jgi:hypothetical protein
MNLIEFLRWYGFDCVKLELFMLRLERLFQQVRRHFHFAWICGKAKLEYD